MCEFCENNKILRSCNFAGSGEIRIYNRGFEKGIGMLELQGDGMKAKIFKNLYCPRFDINYCPMCRKEAGRVKRHASGYWYQFIIPRRLTLPPTRIYRWLNFYWRLKDNEESYDK